MKRQSLDVLLVEDDGVLGGAVAQRLRLEGLSVLWVQTVADALITLQRHDPALMLADIRLPDGTGEEVFKEAGQMLVDTDVIFATAYADIQQAVSLVKAGATDYLVKPYNINDLVRRIKSTLSRAHLPKTTRTAFRNFHHDSPAMTAMVSQLKRLAKESFPILLLGETGTGKELAARLIHESSSHAAAAFIPVSCADISEHALESKYFGHEAGAFPHASARQIGLLEEVGNGTLFLDEVCEMHPKIQAALARVLQDGTFRRIGGNERVRFEGRVVAATNTDITDALKTGRLRQDLYYRLQSALVTIPPLRERILEIVPMAEAQLESYGGSHPLAPFSIADSAKNTLINYPWPGNVRELNNRIARACALADSTTLTTEDFFPEREDGESAEPSLARVRAHAESEEIERVIAESGGRLGEAAKKLGISRTTLWKRRRSRT